MWRRMPKSAADYWLSDVTNATGAKMAHHKTLSRMLIAALLIAGAGPAATESQAKSPGSDGSATQKQGGTKSKGKNAQQDCEPRVVPPFMRNPRFMNRGFLKPTKCREQDQ